MLTHSYLNSITIKLSILRLFKVNIYDFVKEENEVNIFTDFKRFNESHFWSESRQFWLTKRTIFGDAKFFNQDFLFFDEVRYHYNKSYVIVQGWLTVGEPSEMVKLQVRWSLLETWWFQFEVISDAEGNLHNCKGKHSSCICRPNEVIKYVYLISCLCSLTMLLIIILRESIFRLITRIMKIRKSTK